MSEFLSVDEIIKNCKFYINAINNENIKDRTELINDAISYLQKNMPINSDNDSLLEQYLTYFDYLQMLDMIYKKDLKLTDEDRIKIKNYIGGITYNDLMNNIANPEYVRNKSIKEMKMDLTILADAFLMLETDEIRPLKENIYDFVSTNILNKIRFTSFDELNREFGHGDYVILHDESNVAGLNLRKDVTLELKELFDKGELVVLTTTLENYIEMNETIYNLPYVDDFQASGKLIMLPDSKIDIEKMQWCPTMIATMEFAMKHKELMNRK